MWGFASGSRASGFGRSSATRSGGSQRFTKCKPWLSDDPGRRLSPLVASTPPADGLLANPDLAAEVEPTHPQVGRPSRHCEKRTIETNLKLAPDASAARTIALIPGRSALSPRRAASSASPRDCRSPQPLVPDRLGAYLSGSTDDLRMLGCAAGSIV